MADINNGAPVGFHDAILTLDNDVVMHLDGGSVTVTPGLRPKKFHENNGAIGSSMEGSAQPSTLTISGLVARTTTSGDEATAFVNALQADGTGGKAKEFALKIQMRVGSGDTVPSEAVIPKAICTSVPLRGQAQDAARFEATFLLGQHKVEFDDVVT